MIDPDHAKRVLEHQRETPRMVVAKHLSRSNHPHELRLLEADRIIAALVKAGYAIEPIEDDDD